MFDMRRIFLLLVALLTCGLGYAQGPEYSPVWAESGNLDFMMVGNTNHKLVNAGMSQRPADRESEILEGTIEPIDNVKGLFKTITVQNSNYSEFRIAKPKAATCEGELSIKKAFLSWGGRSKSATKNKVTFAIAEGTTPLGEKTITADQCNEGALNGINDKYIYVAYKDVTADVNAMLANANDKDGILKICVANLQTEYDERIYAPSGVQIGNYSGWTFTVIYEYTGLPERSIFYYQPDKVSDVVNTGSSYSADPTLFNLKLDMANKGFDLAQGTTLSIATLGLSLIHI